jgi:hypothetical protein
MNANAIRREASCIGGKTTSPFFIRIYELPQMRVRKMRVIHDERDWPVCGSLDSGFIYFFVVKLIRTSYTFHRDINTEFID